MAETPFWAGLPLGAVAGGGAPLASAGGSLLGVLAAGGLYAKLTTGAAVGWRLAAWIAAGCARAPLPRHARPLDRAGRDSSLLAAPLALWLVGNDFAPLAYAAAAHPTAARRGAGMPVFVLNVAGQPGGHAGDAGGCRTDRAPPRSRRTAAPRRFGADRPARAALSFRARPPGRWCWPSSRALTRSRPQGRRGAARCSTSPGCSPSRSPLARFDARRVAAHRHRCAAALRGRRARSPTASSSPFELARGRHACCACSGRRPRSPERLAGIWDARDGRAPLRIVAGENWVAGLVGVAAKDRPSILNNGNMLLALDHAAALERRGHAWSCGTRAPTIAGRSPWRI